MTETHERPPNANRGFTFTEIVVALAIIAILTAVILPGVSLQLRSAQSASIIQDMRAVNTAIQQYRENVGRYPKNLNQLTSSTVPQFDLCNNALPATLSALWRGPYLAQDVANGFVSGDATFQGALTRSPSSTAPSFTNLDGTMEIDITRVDSLSANTIDVAFDGYTGSTFRFDLGTVHWVPNAGGSGMGRTGTILYILPVRGC